MSTKVTPLGQEIRKIINELGWSQHTLANRAGLTQSAISKIVRGKSKPTPETMDAIGRALNVDPTHLMRLAGIPLPKNKVQRNPSVEYVAQRLDKLPKNMQDRAVEVVGIQIDVFYEMWEREKQLVELTELDAKSQK